MVQTNSLIATRDIMY